MKPKGYLVFHLNLAFSSIEEDAREDIIKACYHNLLDLIEETGIPIGIELTGWTLKQIDRIDSTWIERFKNLLSSGKCELVGSGYCQIIGPLVPYKVNEWNQRLGIETYKEMLGCRPNIILVNEMAFSSSLVDLYSSFGYTGLIMDRDNVRLALDLKNLPMSGVPSHAKGPSGSVLQVLWSDSILFQKVQHFAHGDITIDNYLDYLNKRINNGETLLPIYTNDAEIFDYRPGRFSIERPTHPDGEWNRIKNLLEAIILNTGIKFCSPSQALKIGNNQIDKLVSTLTNAAYPIPVKKQGKYNIARWAVTGRDDLWLNTLCHRIEKHLIKFKNDNHNDWRKLCEFSASDLRTHITDRKWVKTKKRINEFLIKNKISSTFPSLPKKETQYDCLENVIGNYGGAKITIDSDGILMSVSNKKLKVDLNLRRGLTIKALSFASHNMEACIGTLDHGYFSDISLGADFYSGGFIAELPLERSRVTDLEKIEPEFLLKKDGSIQIRAKINTNLGRITKLLEISDRSEKISISYDFSKCKKIIGMVKVGIITLINEFSNKNTKLMCSNGGINYETFNLNRNFDHTEPASRQVSSSRGLGATSGEIFLSNHQKKICLKWDPSLCAAMPMLHNKSNEDKTLSRVLFSIKEVDDTVKYKSKIGSFNLSISAN